MYQMPLPGGMLDAIQSTTGRPLTIQELGALGELLGGIAVVASVLYLAVQIRHGMQGYQSNVTQQITNHFSTLQAQIATSDELVVAWHKAQSGQALTDIEQVRILQLASAYLIGFENMFVQYQNGMLDREAFDARRPVIVSVMSMPGVRDWWEQWGRNQHPAAFVATIDAITGAAQ